MVILYILVALIGGVIGFGVGIILAAAGRFDDADALSAALADAEAEVTLLRRQNASLRDQMAAMAITMDAHRDRAEMLDELSREMNQ